MNLQIPKKYEGWVFVGPVIFFLGFMYLYPLFNALFLSITLENVWNGFNNYLQVLSDRIFWISLSNTALFTLINVTFHFLLALVSALLLSTDIQKNFINIFRGLLMVPWLIATVVAAGAWMLIYHPLGILNHYLIKIGILEIPMAWLGEPNIALLSIVLVNIWKYYPLMMVFFLSGLKAIPKEYYEAAKMDGAKPYQSFFYITLPSLKSIIIFITLLDSVWAFRHFDFAFLMTGGGPMYRTETLSVYTYHVTFQSFKFNYGATIAIILLLISMVFSYFYLRLYKEGE